MYMKIIAMSMICYLLMDQPCNNNTFWWEFVRISPHNRHQKLIINESNWLILCAHFVHCLLLLFCFRINRVFPYFKLTLNSPRFNWKWTPYVSELVNQSIISYLLGRYYEKEILEMYNRQIDQKVWKSFWQITFLYLMTWQSQIS